MFDCFVMPDIHLWLILSRTSAYSLSTMSSLERSSRHSGVLSPQAFRARFGVRVTDWAKVRGYEPKLVYAVMAGARKCLRGDSLRIAKELGLKP